MNVMITGAGGFIGGYLGRLAKSTNAAVLGVDVKKPDTDTFQGDFEICDVRNADHLAALIKQFQPDRIFHLAAQSFPTVSMLKPAETMEINAGGTINVFEAVRSMTSPATVVVACSSAEYGVVEPHNLPVKEDHPLVPLHPYGVSKVAQDLLTSQYFANYRIPCVRIRIFNTTGPGKRDDVCSDFTKRAVELEMGLRGVMMVGSLTTRRAIIDVRDMARGLWMGAEKGAPGDVYNVGSNAIYSGQELIEMIRGHIRVPLNLEQDPSLMRTCDERVIAGETAKFQQQTGWRPEISLPQTVAQMIDWWRDRLAEERASISTAQMMAQ